ncbi:hypothetical protein BW730_07965 [Tessaracoccus aquimaris]|uniref:PASTA domain-containing protein n=1 Tax=Tessaracoccus aquimaris TaxID=1332264 RepID=A0A1Q2CMV3_9ACTN|nr:hypothetical protein BW730_07965 [Tessaracoccus aquimaris]
MHRRRRGVIALLLVLLLTAGAGVGSWWWLSGRYTTVPAVASLNETKAREAADANSLGVSVREEYSETVAKGVVIDTEPGSGERLLRGGSFTLVISRGPERYPMPKVVGVSRDQAEEAIRQHFTIGAVTESFSEDAAEGQVLSASQEEGAELKPGTTVDLMVSKGKEPIRIPNVVASSAANAEKELKALGFKVDVKEENSTSVEKGQVIRQDPSGGNGNRGDTVTIVKSLGPVMVTIPGVWGKNADDAKKLLEDLDLKVEIQNDSGFGLPLNLAKSTDPAEGSQVAVGSTVKLIIV